MRRAFILVLIVCASALSRAQGDNDPATPSKLIAHERAIRVQAWQAKDIRTLNTLLDDDFVYIDEQGGVLNKMQFMSLIQSSNPTQCAVESVIAKLHEDTAIVTGLYQIHGAVKGKPFLRRGRFVDTWLNKGGAWVAVSSLSVAEQP